MNKRSALKASSWRCSGLLPGVSPLCDRTETTLGEIVSPLARPPELSLGALPPREHALEFRTIAESSWRCSGLLPGVSPVFDRTETILGEIVSPLARPPELSLGALPPREHALEFRTIAASSWHCSGLLPGVSPVFDRTKIILGEIVSPLARPPELSLGALPPREHALEFGTITASSWRCSGLLLGVSPVFDRTETILGEIVSPLARPPGLRFPLESMLSSSVPSWHLLGAVAVYYRGSPQYSIVQKLFWGKSFPRSPGPQSCLWERFPLESTLSSSVPSRHLLGAVAVYYRESPQYSIVQKLLWGKSYPHSPGPGLSLGALPPREHALEFGTIAASSWRCSDLLPGISPVFDRTETTLGKIVSPLARLPEWSLGALPPREHALEFGTITASSWRCSSLLPEVSPVFDHTQTNLGETGSPLARPPELSLGALPPREHALEFGAITASSWRCSGLLPLPTCATPHALSREHVLTELSLRPIFACRVLRNSFGAHAGWLRDRRGASSLKLLFCRLPVFNVEKQLDVWDVRADTWG